MGQHESTASKQASHEGYQERFIEIHGFKNRTARLSRIRDSSYERNFAPNEGNKELFIGESALCAPSFQNFEMVQFNKICNYFTRLS